MDSELGFFDSDCLELNNSGTGLGFRPRVEPLIPSLKDIYACAERRGSRLVFTTCCSGRMLREGSLPDVLFVPMDPARREWAKGIGTLRLINLEKTTCGIPSENYKQSTFDAFRYNRNAPELFRLLAVPKWVVFGNGFDLCVNTAAGGLLALGLKVHLLADVTVASAKGYDDNGTEANRQRVLDSLARRGATIGTLKEFLASQKP